MDRPGKGEWYAMQTACEVRRVLSTRPSEHRVNHLKLTFTNDPGEADELDDAAVEELETRKRWDMSAFGGRGVYTPPPAVTSGTDAQTDTSEDDGGGGGESDEPVGDVSYWEDPLT